MTPLGIRSMAAKRRCGTWSGVLRGLAPGMPHQAQRRRESWHKASRKYEVYEALGCATAEHPSDLTKTQMLDAKGAA